MPARLPSAIRVQFVCLGNICRSPTAHHCFQAAVDAAGLSSRFFIESSGTCGHHVGDRPDARMTRSVQQLYGIKMTHRSRQFSLDDAGFDYVFAMDEENLRDIKLMAPGANASLFLSKTHGGPGGSVPDPWYEGNFDAVARLVHDACASLLTHLKTKHFL
jgi:protein-tyrosine phosphatase